MDLRACRRSQAISLKHVRSESLVTVDRDEHCKLRLAIWVKELEHHFAVICPRDSCMISLSNFASLLYKYTHSRCIQWISLAFSFQSGVSLSKPCRFSLCCSPSNCVSLQSTLHECSVCKSIPWILGIFHSIPFLSIFNLFFSKCEM